MSVDEIPAGQQRAALNWDEYSRVAFIAQQAVSKMQTATLVKIVACTNSGGLSPVGFVDVIPLVNQIDGQGNPERHVTVYNLPYLRIQGGSNAIIIDPEVGDIGVAVFASRDISKVKKTKDQANPGSYRQYSFSDGMYLGGMLNGTPTQYVQFSSAGVKVLSPVAVILEAPDIQLTGTDVSVTATNFSVASTTFTHNSTNIGANHQHSGVQTGTSNTGPPV